MVSKTKVFSKTFRKPRRVPLMPEGDGVELGNHLIKKWCTEASDCVCFQKRIRFKICRPFPTLHVQPRYPLWDGALLITLVGSSREPILLVAGVTWSLSIRGRASQDDHALSSQALGTPLVPAWMLLVMYIMWAGYQLSGLFV